MVSVYVQKYKLNLKRFYYNNQLSNDMIKSPFAFGSEMLPEMIVYLLSDSKGRL